MTNKQHTKQQSIFILQTKNNHKSTINDRKNSLFPSNVTSMVDEIKIARQVAKRVKQIYSSKIQKKQNNNQFSKPNIIKKHT